jgi:hypothetical protein
MTDSRLTQVRRRGAWALVVALGVTVLVALALSGAEPSQNLDPDSKGPTGGKALVEVLRQHGVKVQVVRSVSALADASPASGTTVVMANPEYLGSDSAVLLGKASADADRLVLLSPSTQQLAALDLPLTSGPAGALLDVSSGCTSPIARRSDTVTVVDVRFATKAGASTPVPQLCFALPHPRGDGTSQKPDIAFGAAMATVPATTDRPEVVALGLETAFTNRWVQDKSHAGLAVRALGHSPRLLWYQPGVGDVADFSGQGSPTPWPRWLGPAAAVLATAVLVLAVVRGRRMGALVAEPLPVVVRAVETTESRGRLYRRARDRPRAAAILRAATTQRVARRLAVTPGDVPGVLQAAASASGMPPATVGALLTGPPPTTDAELHSLASSLTELEERVRTS